MFIRPIRHINKDNIRRCLCKLDYIVWGEEDEVDVPIISYYIAEGPAIIINKLLNEAFNWGITVKSLITYYCPEVLDFACCNKCIRVSLNKSVKDKARLNS